MDTASLSALVDDEFAPTKTYLNTASCGLLPRRTLAAVTALAQTLASGRADGSGDFAVVEAVRDRFARLAGVGADRVAIGGSVSVHVGLIAASLPPGAEVLAPQGEFSSVVGPLAIREDLRMRYVPLDRIAESVGPDTALVALSSTQSADGRIAGLKAIRAAAADHGARTLIDATQSAGWLPMDAGEYDYTVTGGFKFLLCPRGTSFLTVTEAAQPALPPLYAGMGAAVDPWSSVYGPVERLSPTARRFDAPPAFLAYHGAERSLALLDEIGVETVHAHATGLAARLRAGLARLGHETVPGDSPIVAAPGLGDREPELARAGVVASNRAGNLRAAFHLYNTEADVDRVLNVLAG
ncbi:aminotransferase class V-fold PLP-dependent enzyme [Streptomyces sp. NPDC058195]|uniref:aminotransferase class V-fold PLP-dependent enzyme n=1 Tax=Streptomyces sp. NPDC058195 TaxID=3346375 RepID=UPI0036E2958A